MCTVTVHTRQLNSTHTHTHTQEGVSFPGTGGSYIAESWFGQWAPFEEHDSSMVTATAINITGSEHDCMLTQIVIWSGRVGVADSNGGNEFNGVHTWNLSGEWGGIGMLLVAGRARIVNCYMDFAPIVAIHPRHLVVTNTLFLGAATILLQPPPPQQPVVFVDGLVVSNNLFNNKNASIIVEDPSGQFQRVKDAGER